MNQRVVGAVSGLVLGVGVLCAVSAQAQPVGTWSCNAVGGSSVIPLQLYSSGTDQWKFKGQGWAVNCDNTGNTGDPVVYASYKFKGYHLGPNTCTAAGGPTYHGILKVKWYYFDASNSTVPWVTSTYGSWNAVMPYSSGACPGPFTAGPLTWVGGYNGGPSATLSGTQTNPSCGVMATQCASTFPTGFSGYSYGSPGSLSVP